MTLIGKIISSSLARRGAVMLLSSPRVRRVAIRLAKNPRVQRVLLRQVVQRLRRH